MAPIDCRYTTPGKAGVGGGAGTTWLVGSPQDATNALLDYWKLGVTHFVLSGGTAQHPSLSLRRNRNSWTLNCYIALRSKATL